jgi:hypothetical protein
MPRFVSALEEVQAVSHASWHTNHRENRLLTGTRWVANCEALVIDLPTARSTESELLAFLHYENTARVAGSVAVGAVVHGAQLLGGSGEGGDAGLAGHGD